MKNINDADKKTPRYASRVSDILMYSFCILGILISLNCFRLDLFRTMTRQTEQPVGTVTFKYRAAQRRFADRVLWDRLRRESPVYDGDSIRTAELSEATISFAGGAVINLEENSLVQIHDDRRGPRIDIGGGGLSAVAADGGTLVLVSGLSAAVLEPGSAARAGADGGGFRLQVSEGAASLTVDGETRTAAAGEFLAAGNEGPEGAFRPAALSPRPQARLLYPGQGTLAVSFRWTRRDPPVRDPPRPAGREAPVRLELAEDRGFTRIVFRGDFTGAGEPAYAGEAAAELEAGSYFWRVFPAGENPPDVSSFEIFPFKIIAAPAPVLITPAEGYVYQFRVRRPAVRFQWTETGDAVSYVLEAADNPQMRNPVFSREVRGTSLHTSELGPGTWYWRVRPVFPALYEGEAGEGGVRSFRIEQNGDLGVPVLQSPAGGAPVNIAAGRDLYFSWRREAEAQVYTIRISANGDLRSPLITAAVQDTFYACRVRETRMTPGRYYWAVFQTDAEGNDSAPSPARTFTALEGEAIQRAVFPPEAYRIGRTFLPDIRFSWKSTLPFPSRFQVSPSADFSRLVIDEAVNGEILTGRFLPEGLWYWRIQAGEPEGAVFETPPRSFIVLPPLPAPLLTEPAPDRRVVVLEGERQRFSWGPSPGAEYYQFKLYHASDRNRAVYENNFLEETALSFALDAYPEGNYVWTVQGFVSESVQSTRLTGLLAEGAFISRKIHPVRLDYPDDGISIPGLRAYFEPGTARWSSTEPAASRFILSRSRDFSISLEAVINNPSQSVRLPRLRAGDYYWTIRAETMDGLDISARSPRLIRVLPVPPLPAAANRRPADGARITEADLKQNRSIVFSWDPAPGATGYLFTLEKEPGTALIQEGPFEETRFVLEDLTLLDLGTFIWRLEAVMTEPVRERQEDTGEIFRRGETAENRFTVDFIRPDVPVLPAPGVLYGRE
jgi:hypothetical protein